MKKRHFPFSKSLFLSSLLTVIFMTVITFYTGFLALGFSGMVRPVKNVSEEELQKAKERMIKKDLLGRDITNARVLEVMLKVPRHLFVDDKYRSSAYDDHPLPIEEGQTISQPYVVALMTQSIRLKPEEKVLEIGTGSGYQAAVLSEITDFVYTIEIREKLAEKSSQTLKRLGYGKVKVKAGDGYFGWPENAPFQAIMVTAAANHVPPPLIRQLDEGGRLIIPLGSTTYYQNLALIEKQNGEITTRYMGRVRFVPMTGRIQESSDEN